MSKVKYPQQEFRLPRGRYVRGSFVKKSTTNHKNEPLPENKHHFWIAMAVEKNAPGVNDVNNALITHTWNSYSNVAGNQAVMQQLGQMFAAPSFAWKIDDGDTDPRWSQRDGCRGCWIYNLSTTFNLETFDGLNRKLDPSCFVPGDYMDAYIGAAINGETDVRVAGIYLNPVCLRWLESGPRITIGRDAATVFGDTVGQGYVAPQAGAMPTHLAGGAPQLPPSGGPGGGGQAPGHYAPPQQHQAPPAPPQQHQAPPETTEQWNLRHTGHAAPGYRWNPQTNAWDVDAPTPPPSAQPAAPAQQYAGGYANAPQAGYNQPPQGNAYAGGQGAPAYGQPPQGAPSAGHGGPQGTAYPGNYGPGNPPPGVQQQNYAGGPPRMG